MFEESQTKLERYPQTKNYNDVNFLQTEPSFVRRKTRHEGWLSLRGKDVRKWPKEGRDTRIYLWEQLFVDWVVDRAHLHKGKYS